MVEVGIRINIDGNKTAVDGFDQITQATGKTGDAAVSASKKITSAQQDVVQSAAQLSISQKNVGEAMAQAGTSSQQAGQKIVTANQQTSSSTTQLTQSQQRFLDGLVKQSDAIGKSNSQLALMRAQQLGVADAAAPMIAKLAQAEQGVQKVGMSAAATSAAMRNVPAQFTDIVTSLQGGQAPLTVFMQQGGQLKDMFGGAGNAAKALGGYVMGLINPFTVAAAAAVGLGAAYYYGSEQSKRMQVALIATGNYAGTTGSQLDLIAQKVGAATGKYGEAREAVVALAESGKFSANAISALSGAVVASSNLTGKSIEDTVSQFAKLKSEPTKAISELNEKYNFLTVDIYKQIKALEDRGEVEKAAALAMNVYADTVKTRNAEVLGNLGYIEKAWKGIKEESASALDTFLGFGRVKLDSEKLAVARNQLGSMRQTAGNVAPDSRAAKEIADQEKLVKSLEAAIVAKNRDAEATGRQSQAQKELKTRNDELAKYLDSDKHLTKAKALELEGQAFKKATQGFSKDSQEYRQALEANAIANKKIEEGFKPKNENAAKEVTAYNTLILSIKEKLAVSQAELASDQNLTEGQKARIKFDTELREGKIVATAAQRDYARSLAGQLDINNQMAAFEKEQLNRTKKIIDGFKEQYEATVKINRSIEDYVTSMDALNEQTQLESTLAGKSERERKIALEQFKVELELRKQIKAINASSAFEADKPGLIQKATTAAESRKEAVIVQVDTEEIQKARKELDAFLDPSKAQSFGDAMVSAMGNTGNALQKLSVSLQEYGRSELEIAKQRENAEKTKSADPAKYAKDMAALNDKSAQAQIKNYANMAGAAKGFFKENSTGYRAMEGAEKAFRAAELAMSIETMLTKSGLLTAFTGLFVASKATETAATTASIAPDIAASVAKGTAAAAVGVANQAQGDPYSAFARMAVMAAAMAALGFAVSGGGGSSGPDVSAAAVQKRQGTGTVFGDSDAKSDSIKQSLDLLNNNSDLMVPATMQMAASLRNIESSMVGLTNIIFRTTGVTDGSNMGIKTGTIKRNDVFEKNGFSAGSATGWALMFFDPISKVLGQLMRVWGSTKQSITDGGLQIGGSVGSLQQGQGVNQYANVATTTSSWFGLKKSTSNSTQTQAVSSEISQQFSAIFTNLQATLSSAATALGGNGQAVGEAVKLFVIDTTKISLQGLKGADLQNAINGVISGAMDNVAQSVFPELEKFRQVGEGYTETVVRIAVNYSSVDAILTSVGMKFGAVGISSVAARENLIGLVGGIDKLASGTQYFAQNFLTDAERIKPVSDNVTKVMADLGLSGVTSLDQFKSVVMGLDLSTEAGAKLYATLIGLAPQFKEVADFNSNASGTAKQRADLEIQIMELTGNMAGALTAKRAIELAGMDASLRPLQQRIYLLNDEADAAAKAAALGQQRTSFEIRIMELSGDKIGALNMKRKQELDGLDASLRPYQLQIYALEDKAEAEKGALAAQQASTQAAEKAAQAAQQLASAWQSAVNSMVSEINRLRGLVGGNSAASLANAQSQFSITTAQARAGDQEAFKLLPQLSQTLEKMYEASAGSLAELNRNRNLLAASLEQTAQGTTKYGVKIPGFASGGDFGGGLRLVGEHGPEIEATGASRIFNANQTKSMLGGSNDALVNALITEVRELKAAMSLLLAPTVENEKNTRKIKDNVQRVTLDGEGMRLETVTA
ncbi:phage tail length tape measure family protein [Undibacterium sp. Ren11W]|uniref:phage tail length tape measure family protein n=1 Tax=Undibacterium sp. Ren11W TaxID=3413045 RepID=UPI003BF1A259